MFPNSWGQEAEAPMREGSEENCRGACVLGARKASQHAWRERRRLDAMAPAHRTSGGGLAAACIHRVCAQAGWDAVVSGERRGERKAASNCWQEASVLLSSVCGAGKCLMGKETGMRSNWLERKARMAGVRAQWQVSEHNGRGHNTETFLGHEMKMWTGRLLPRGKRAGSRALAASG